MITSVHKRIILARHGETTGNRQNLVMGRSDFPLTSEGADTAKQVGLLVQHENIAGVFSSPLGRAVTSAKLYVSGTGLSVNTREGLAELACGQWEGRQRSEVLEGKRAVRETWFDRPPGGESYGDAESRVQPVIRELLSETTPQCLLVVGHAGINRVLLRLLLNLDPETAVSIKCPHDSIYLIEDGRVRMESTTGRDQEGLMIDRQ